MDEAPARRFYDALDRIERRTYEGVVYRHYAPGYRALSGEGARRNGGRWNPPESFSVIYTASSVETVDAEFRPFLASARLPVTRPRELATIRVELKRVLDLRSESIRRALDIELEDISAEDLSIPRAIGEAAQHLGYEAIVAPLATGIGHVVALFLTNRAPESSIEVVETQGTTLTPGRRATPRGDVHQDAQGCGGPAD